MVPDAKSPARRRRLGRWAFAALGAVIAAYAIAVGAFLLSQPDVHLGPVPENPIVTALPAGFLWGAATSAHQIEGGNVKNDWAVFEAVPGNIRGGVGSGVAADDWNRVAEDVGLLSDLGANAYRFSIEWSRVEPEPGRWDEAAWAHYAGEIEQLRAAGIEPMITLLHFTIPAWLAGRGGLTADDFARRFAAFAAEAARRFGSQVRDWCTINEPNVQMYEGYVEGAWPPGLRDRRAATRAFAGLVRAHALAARAIKAARADARIGVAMNLIAFQPSRRWYLPDWIGAREADRGFNWSFYDSIKRGAITLHLSGFPELDEPLPELAGSADFFGVNYYRRNLVRFRPGAPGLVELLQGPGPRSDTDVEVYPDGMLALLRRVWHRYHLPIIITENGVADSTDRLRPAFLRSHVYAMVLAIREGVPVEGYFHWSLMDNFEWNEGFGPRFGLYRVNYVTQARVAGAGAAEFRRLVGLAAAAGSRRQESQ
jgi:beta-glucosidase